MVDNSNCLLRLMHFAPDNSDCLLRLMHFAPDSKFTPYRTYSAMGLLGEHNSLGSSGK